MKKKGFTLLETLITALIFGFMATGVMYFVSNSHKIMTSGIRQANIHTNASRILNMIATDIKEGAYVKNDGSILKCIITQPDGTEIKWNSQWIDGKFRIFRNGVEIPFFGDRGVITNWDHVYMSMDPTLKGKYFETKLIFRVRTDNEYVSLNSTVYCRHDPNGFFDPDDFIEVED